ncbi:MAG TPA: M48 family metalloprotease [Methylomirabilota bacterium]
MGGTSWWSSYYRWGWPAKFLAWILVTALLCGCASTNVPPMGYQGKPFRPEPDERKLWSDAEKEEEKLAKLGKTYDDPLLEDYLASVAARLVPEEAQEAGAPAPRIAVFRDPALNAFAMPNGKIYVHTGLLSRVENESQLSMILGHEMTHVTNRHALMFNRDAQNKQIWFTALAIAASLGVAVAAGGQQGKGNYVSAEVLRTTSNIFLGLGLQLAFIASVNGFGRDLEREADREGMDRMVKAGYDPREAPRVFALLKNDHGDGSKLENFFFGNHPRLDERIANTQELLKTKYANVDTGDAVANNDEFAMRTRTVVRENAALDIRAGRFGLAKAQLDRVLPLAPKDPTTHLYYGDLYRLQAQRARNPFDKPMLVAQALQAYEKAAELDATFPDPFRQMGFLYYQSRQSDKAKEAFRKYLALKPDAPDSRRIKEYLVELER